MASGIIDNFQPVKGTSSATIQGKIDWSSVGDAAKNESVVTTVLWVRRTDNYTSSPTYGKDWKGTVKVGSNTEHKFTGFSSSVSVASNWVKLATYTDVIKHNTDGTCSITISGSVTGPSGTSLSSATSSGSKTVELDRLHKIPDNIQYTMIETNQKLIAAGISNDVFVKGLSVKSFDISGNTYDGATIKEYAVFNRLNAFGSSSLPLILDLSKYELQTDLTYVSKIPIMAQLIDSFDTAGYSETILYDYIQYSKVNLIETSTTAKRNGQTSGKVKLNVSGNFFNGIVGNIDQTSYKPIVKYKFWKLNDPEPTTYGYVVASDAITVENDKFNVDGFEIGSSDEKATNYFNPDLAYRVRVYIEDNFTSYESEPKPIPVGEATWTEYKDRVDFKNATIKGAKVSSSIVSPTTPTKGEEVWIQTRENLFNKDTITTDTFVDETGALLTDSNVWNLSDYIAVEPNENYTYRGIATVGTRPYFCFYDVDKNFVSSIKQETGINTITIPNNVHYIRCSVYDYDINSFRFEHCTSDEVVDKAILIKKSDGSYEEFGDNQQYTSVETRIGTWIDGSPIYRKVIPFYFSSSANQVAVAHNIDNLGYAIKVYGFIPNGNENRLIPQFYYTMDKTYAITPYHVSSTAVNIFYGDFTKNSLKDNQCYIIIEYTKTTD